MSFGDIIEYSTEEAIPTTSVFANRAAWHKTGTVLDTEGNLGLTVEEALEPSGLGFTVVKTPIYVPNVDKNGNPVIRDNYPVLMTQSENATKAGGYSLEVDRQFGVIRTDTGYCLGVVGETWEPFQPLDAFALVDDLIRQAGGTDTWIESAGELDKGRKIWVMVHLPSDLQIAGETYASYLLFTTGYDGRLSNTAAAINIRVECANTLNYALYGDAKQTGRVVRVRHTKNAADRVKEAATVLGIRNKFNEQMAQQAEWLVNYTMDEGEFNNFLETLMPVDEDQEDKPAGTMIRNRQDGVRRIYFDAENLNQIRGTAWGAFQSVLEYADHGRKFSDEETRTKAQLGINNPAIKQEAYNLAYAFAMSN